jgi:DNA invertase Pin-like site-specific DNA recombinase
VGPRFISPSVQREQIEQWASLNDATLGEVFEELDESGARQDRPLLMQALARVESGQSDGILVARLDRFGRSLTGSLAAIERLRAAGGTFISVQDGLDLRTPTGKLVLRIMFSMAEWELDRIRSNWQIAKARAIDRGVHVGSWPPFGYRRDKHGRLKPDPRTAPRLTDVFRRRAKGVSIRELCRSLEAKRIVTTHGNVGWSETSLSGILSNRVYLGELRAGSRVATNTHKPLVDRVTWQAAQNPRMLPVRRRHIPTLLGGLLRCGACSMALHSQTVARANGYQAAVYACHGLSAEGDCAAPAHISGGLIEPYVEQAFFSRLARQRHLRTPSTRRLRALERRSTEAEAALHAYRDHPRLQLLLGDGGFADGLEARIHVRDESMKRLVAEKRRVEQPILPSSAEIEEQWPSMTVEGRREAIGEALECVFVWRGRKNVVARTHICYRGEAPPDLPRPGVKRRSTRPIDPKTLPPEPRISQPKPWTKKRIRKELEVFLGEYESWPPANTFYRAGRGPLYARIVRSGGPNHWAKRLGVEPPKGTTGLTEWNEADVRATLADLLRGRRVFLSRRQFIEAGHGSLFGWLCRNGGLDHWAEEFELPRPKPGPA